jgi:hypothetical protein
MRQARSRQNCDLIDLRSRRRYAAGWQGTGSLRIQCVGVAEAGQKNRGGLAMWRSLLFLQIGLTFLIPHFFADITQAALLAEIGINVEPAFDPSPPLSNSVIYSFNGGAPGSIGVFERQVTASDVGFVFEAPIDVVQKVAQGFPLPSAGVNIRLHNISYSKPLDQLQSSGWGLGERASFQKFVPDITKVPINRITMSIGSFTFIRTGDNANIGGAHLIRIYGIPEPNCVALSLTSIFCVVVTGYRLSGRH